MVPHAKLPWQWKHRNLGWLWASGVMGHIGNHRNPTYCYVLKIEACSPGDFSWTAYFKCSFICTCRIFWTDPMWSTHESTPPKETQTYFQDCVLMLISSKINSFPRCFRHLRLGNFSVAWDYWSKAYDFAVAGLNDVGEGERSVVAWAVLQLCCQKGKCCDQK